MKDSVALLLFLLLAVVYFNRFINAFNHAPMKAASKKTLAVLTPTTKPSIKPTVRPNALCAQTIGPNVGCCSVGGYAGIQTISSVCLTTEVTTIADQAFCFVYFGYYNPASITYIFIPSTVSAIGVHAFFKTPLKAITFAGNVGTIGYGAFGQTSLKTLTFPGNVETIGSKAFANMNSLENVIPRYY